MKNFLVRPVIFSVLLLCLPSVLAVAQRVPKYDTRPPTGHFTDSSGGPDNYRCNLSH